MTARDFCYWLQGYFELNGPGSLSNVQALAISNHLSLVFAHDIDPKAGGPDVQKKLNDIHGLRPDNKDVVYRC